MTRTWIEPKRLLPPHFKTRRPCVFFSLPYEIRLRIYHFTTPEDDDVLVRLDETLQNIGFVKLGSPFALTCRQIQEEMMQAMYPRGRLHTRRVHLLRYKTSACSDQLETATTWVENVQRAELLMQPRNLMKIATNAMSTFIKTKDAVIGLRVGFGKFVSRDWGNYNPRRTESVKRMVQCFHKLCLIGLEVLLALTFSTPCWMTEGLTGIIEDLTRSGRKDFTITAAERVVHVMSADTDGSNRAGYVAHMLITVVGSRTCTTDGVDARDTRWTCSWLGKAYLETPPVPVWKDNLLHLLRLAKVVKS